MLPLNKYTVVGAGVALLVAVYFGRKAVQAVPDALNAVNPFNYDNIINKGVTDLYQGLTGSNGSIGTDLYDATHGGRLDVTSSNNAAAATVDWFGGKITGNDSWSLGTAIYNWTH